MDQGPLGTGENASMGKALTRTAQVYDPGERREIVRQRMESGHLSKPSVI